MKSTGFIQTAERGNRLLELWVEGRRDSQKPHRKKGMERVNIILGRSWEPHVHQNGSYIITNYDDSEVNVLQQSLIIFVCWAGIH